MLQTCAVKLAVRLEARSPILALAMVGDRLSRNVSGSCFAQHGTAGCDDADCCNAVCDVRLFCCLGGWDTNCAAAALATAVVLKS